jgi:hypothetical protein
MQALSMMRRPVRAGSEIGTSNASAFTSPFHKSDRGRGCERNGLNSLPLSSELLIR